MKRRGFLLGLGAAVVAPPLKIAWPPARVASVSFVMEYERAVHEIFQRQGRRMSEMVRRPTAYAGRAHG